MSLGRLQRAAGKIVKKIRIPEDSGSQDIFALKKSLIPDQTVVGVMNELIAEIIQDGGTPSPLLKRQYNELLDRKHDEDATKRGRFWIFEVIAGKKQLVLETSGSISLLEVDHNEHPDAEFFLVQFRPLTPTTPVKISSRYYSVFSESRIGSIKDNSEFTSLASLATGAGHAIRPNDPNDHLQFSPVRISVLAYRGSKGPNGTEIIFVPDVSP
ncbi:MAG: hypothetical protein IPJ71_11505 [Bdellovibrionales bacterium]|nr:hypothetical protein [Bdellovibrionales bacterium]